MNCSMNLAGVTDKLAETYQVPVHVGTHDR
jgi:hypothetical protein